MVLFEYPYNERIRSFLRLEHLFKRLFFFKEKEGAEYEYAMLSVLFEIMDVCDRGEIRNNILQEIHHQKDTLGLYRADPNADETAINDIMTELNTALRGLTEMQRIGHEAKEDEWLLKLKNRYKIPGGTSSMDFPAYHAWLNLPKEVRFRSIDFWLTSFLPLSSGIAQVLKLIRASREPQFVSTDAQGVLQFPLSGRAVQLIRIWLPEQQGLYPETSGNKHLAIIHLQRLNVRFLTEPIHEVVNFKLALCHF